MTEEEIEVTRGWPRDDEQQHRKLPEHRGRHVTPSYSRVYICIYLYAPHAREKHSHVKPSSLRVGVTRTVHISRDANPRRGGGGGGPPRSPPSFARDAFFPSRAVYSAIPRENAGARFLTAPRAHGTRVTSNAAGALPHTRERDARFSVASDVRMLRDARRDDARTTRSAGLDWRGSETRNGASGVERAHGERRAACLPRESHNQLCATIAMGRLGSEQAYLPESGRAWPRLAEVHLRGNPTMVVVVGPRPGEIERPRSNETGIEFKIH